MTAFNILLTIKQLCALSLISHAVGMANALRIQKKGMLEGATSSGTRNGKLACLSSEAQMSAERLPLRMPIILSKIRKHGGKINKVYGDKSYISRACFEAIERNGGKAIIDIPKNVKIKNKVRQRDRILRQINELVAKGWKQ